MSENNPAIIELPNLEHPDAWETPILFDEINTPEIPANLLPDCLGDFSSALANATETPAALSVMSVLGVLAAALSKKFIVCPQEGWENPVNLYIFIALPPANNKTAVLNHCTKPLKDYEHEQQTLLEPEIRRQRSKRKTEEKIIEGLRIRVGKEKDELKRNHLKKEIEDMELLLTEPMVLPNLFANDSTPEALSTSIHEQGGRFAILSDEGGILETLGGLYCNGNANVDILLKGIDGGEIRVKRKDRSFNVRPYLTILLAVQPAIIQNMSKQRSFRGNGALERFLYVLPASKLGYRTHDKQPISQEIRRSYENKIKSLLEIPLMIENGQEKPYVLSLSEDALRMWKGFQLNVERDLRPDGRLSICPGWGGKICGFCLRIAGLLHVAEHSCRIFLINGKTMANAIEMSDLLIEHAIAGYGYMSLDEITNDAKEIFKWITTNQKINFRKSDLTNGFRNRKITLEQLSKGLRILAERNIIGEPRKLPTKKPTTVYDVNPTIFNYS